MKIKTPNGILDIDGRQIIHGIPIDVKAKMNKTSPIDGSFIAEFSTGSKKDVERAVADSKKAFVEWSKISLKKRIQIIQKLKKEIAKEFDNLSAIETLETGKPLALSGYGPTYMALILDYYISHANEFIGDEEIHTPFISNLIFSSRKNIKIFRPRGVIGIIVPWNFPTVLSSMSIIPALIAGNTIVFKPSSKTPFTGFKIAQIMNRVLPPGVFNLIQGKGSVTGNLLVKSDIDMIVFTGSTRVGSKIGEICGKKMIPCTLELGGLDPFIVLEDADLEETTNACVYGSFINSGQMCIASKRIIVPKKMHKEFLSLVIKKTKDLRIGNGFDPNTDAGPLISKKQLEKVEKFVWDAVQKGAKIEIGGKRIKGNFFEPTILTNVNENMLVACSEPFGPIMPIFQYSDIDEAIRLANSTEYGLGASIWSRSMKKAEAVSRKIQSGTIWINEVGIPFAHAPYGGLKKSGIHKENAIEGIRGMCNESVISIPKTHSKTRPYWFPMDASVVLLEKRIVELLCTARLIKKPFKFAKMIQAYLKTLKKSNK